MSEYAFEEVQAFRQPQLWIPLILLALFVVGFQAFFIVRSAGNASLAQWLALGLSIAVFGGVILLIAMVRLEVRVNREGLETRFYPLEIDFRRTGWDDIASWREEVLHPMRNHGGWGLRKGLKSKAYIISGTDSVAFSLKNGHTLYVNTQRPTEFIMALEKSRPGGGSFELPAGEAGEPAVKGD